MPNTINDLRTELFATLRALRDPTNPMDIERAKAIAGVANVVVASAKVEVDFAKVTGERAGTGFLPQAIDDDQHKLTAAHATNGSGNGLATLRTPRRQ